MSLKALAENVISRNQQCNTHATAGEFTRNYAATNHATELHEVNTHHAEETEVLHWLERIGEHDKAVIAETIQKCRARPDWRDAFVRAARGDYSGVH